MIPLAVVILGGSRNTWDTDRTLGTGELNDTAVVILGGSRNRIQTVPYDRKLNDTAVVILGGSGIQTVPWGQEN